MIEFRFIFRNRIVALKAEAKSFTFMRAIQFHWYIVVYRRRVSNCMCDEYLLYMRFVCVCMSRARSIQLYVLINLSRSLRKCLSRSPHNHFFGNALLESPHTSFTFYNKYFGKMVPSTTWSKLSIKL